MSTYQYKVLLQWSNGTVEEHIVGATTLHVGIGEPSFPVPIFAPGSGHAIGALVVHGEERPTWTVVRHPVQECGIDSTMDAQEHIDLAQSMVDEFMAAAVKKVDPGCLAMALIINGMGLAKKRYGIEFVKKAAAKAMERVEQG